MAEHSDLDMEVPAKETLFEKYLHPDDEMNCPPEPIKAYSTPASHSPPSSSSHLGHAGPSQPYQVPAQTGEMEVEEEQGATNTDDKAEQGDDDQAGYSDDEIDPTEEDEQMLQDVVNVLFRNGEVPDMASIRDKKEEISRLETLLDFHIRRLSLCMTEYPAMLYRTTKFSWDKGPVLSKTQRTERGVFHMSMTVVVICVIHHLLVYGEVVCVRGVWYRSKKQFIEGGVEYEDHANDNQLTKRRKSKEYYGFFLMILKELCLTTVVDRDRYNVDAETKGYFYGDMRIFAKFPEGEQMIQGNSVMYTPIPPCSTMLRVEFGRGIKRVVGFESVGPLSRGQTRKSLLKQGSIIIVSKGHCDRNILRLLNLITTYKEEIDITIPTLWLGDGNTAAYWIFCSVKRGNKATIFQNSKLVAIDAIFVGPYSSDVSKANPRDQIKMDAGEVARLESFIKDPSVPQEMVPIAKKLLQLGKTIESDNLQSETLIKIIIKRGDSLAKSPPALAKVEDLYMLPAFTRENADSIPLLDFRELPPAPGQPGGDLCYQFEVDGQCFSHRLLWTHADQTTTVASAKRNGSRLLPVQYAEKLFQRHDKIIKLLVIMYENYQAASERSPNKDFKQGFFINLNALRKFARSFLPTHILANGTVPARVLAKAHWLAYHMLTVSYAGPIKYTMQREVCLACGEDCNTKSLAGQDGSHFVANRFCARTVAKIRPENAPEVDQPNTDPHWCPINPCRGKPPHESQDAFDQHWLTHRVICTHCHKDFESKKELAGHMATCKERVRRVKFRQDNGIGKSRCPACGNKQVNRTAHYSIAQL
ncbi:unnamed protein product [Rhizoctonia solani]|uniref:Topoisomerase 6 subunit A/Spo11 TOPRIM domain-containing protein n=1 Tax=Rhizoctonia solani TaxID=456999 RepID=A0A8H2X7K6_9AGAM|nr:unnamed protein product [Rhizoctonia solani]